MNTDQLSMIMANRLKAAREKAGLSHVALSNALKEKYNISISKDSLMNYEVATANHTKAYKNKGMNIEYLICLADFFGVSCDYLLGLSDVAFPDTDLRGVCDFTGLSELAVTQILRLNYYSEEAEATHPFARMKLFNRLIEDFRISGTFGMLVELQSATVLHHIAAEHTKNFVACEEFEAARKIVEEYGYKVCHPGSTADIYLHEVVREFEDVIKELSQKFPDDPT